MSLLGKARSCTHGLSCLVRVGDGWQCRIQVAAGRGKPLVAIYVGGIAWKSSRLAARNGHPVITEATPSWTNAEADAWWERRMDAVAAARVA